MSHIASPHLVDYLGLLAGGLAVSIAIFLQMVMARRCKVEYVVGFFILGVALLALNTEPFLPPIVGIHYLRGGGYVLLILSEVYAAWHVYQHSEILDLDAVDLPDDWLHRD